MPPDIRVINFTGQTQVEEEYNQPGPPEPNQDYV
jgi:hypothetical protein